jgi:hypothetical protein
VAVTATEVGVRLRVVAARVAVAARRFPRAVEAGVVTVLSGALAVWAYQDSVRGLATTVPGDFGDPVYFSWQLAWVGHAVRTDPGGVWTTPAFLGAPDNLAYTDTVWGYLPLSFLVPQGQTGALAQLNLALLLATALAAASGYALVRALGSGIAGAALAGVASGFAPWRLTQVIHINVLSTAGIAFALALTARGHGWSMRYGWQPERMSPRLVAAGWVVSAWQITFGFATGIWFVYTMALVTLVLALGWLLAGRRRVSWSQLPKRLVVAEVVGGLAFLGWLALMLRPYLRVVGEVTGAQRVEAMLGLFSPSWKGLLTAPTTDWFWGDKVDSWRAGATWPPEMFMSPGFVLLAVAVVGLFYSAWPWWRRLVVALVTAVLVVLAMGTNAPRGGAYTIVPLFHHLPGWDHLRTPGRLVIWVALGLVVLAAGALTRLTEDVQDVVVQGRFWRLAAAMTLLLPAGLAYGEGWNTVPHWQVPAQPVRLADLPQPVLVLPSGVVADYHIMLWQTEGWPVIANGDSGFDSGAQASLRAGTLSFPDPASIALLRHRGIATVVIVRDRVGAPDLWDGDPDVPITGLGITRRVVSNAVIFDVRSSG